MGTEKQDIEFENALAEHIEPFDEFLESLGDFPAGLPQTLIEDKLLLMHVLGFEIAISLRIRDKLKDPVKKFEIDHYIGKIREYIALLDEAITFNRGLCDGTNTSQAA